MSRCRTAVPEVQGSFVQPLSPAPFKYRPEIDGLRAVAVLCVVLYHANFGFTGGYVGVDVFFVISGFLITSLILKDQQADKFSLVHFWERRVRRILPAAACVVLAVMATGFFLFVPIDFEDLAESSIFQQLLLANVYFWQDGGYFGGPAELKPLLHTWSLAVEEQFYLGFPLLLVLCKRLRRAHTVAVLCLLTLASFALSEWGARANPSAAFFLLPTRAWELFIGGLLAFAPRPSRITPWQGNLMSCVGLVGIGVPAFLYDNTTRFPGASAMLPCLGTALIIYANSHRQSLVGSLLSTRPLVFVGLISYSLYLWHWPILAFIRYSRGTTLTVSLRLWAIALSFICAYLSWRFVETPFRRRKAGSNARRVFASGFLCAACVLGVSVFIRLTEGLPIRLPAHVRRLAENSSVPERFRGLGPEEVRNGALPTLGPPHTSGHPPAFLVWGDSHAMAISELCDTLAREHGLSGNVAARTATVSLLGVWRPSSANRAVEWNQEVLEFVRREKIRNVILVSRWAVNIEGRPDGKNDALIVDEQSRRVSRDESKQVLRRGLLRTISALQQEGVKVWIMKQVPLQDKNPLITLTQAAWSGVDRPPRGVSLENHRKRQENVDDVLNTLENGAVEILDPTEYCFDDTQRSLIGSFERSFYADDDHLSPFGAERLLREMLEPVFAEIAGRHAEHDHRWRDYASEEVGLSALPDRHQGVPLDGRRR